MQLVSSLPDPACPDNPDDGFFSGSPSCKDDTDADTAAAGRASPDNAGESSDVIGLEAIWIGLDLSENDWTGFGFLEDLDWIGLIGNQLLELQWSNLIR
ncbi:hypothetical protein FPOAC2_14072 [Fusarium poae]